MINTIKNTSSDIVEYPTKFCLAATDDNMLKLFLHEYNVSTSIDFSQVYSNESTIIREPYYREIDLILLASEKILSRDWEKPEEDKAWQDL